MAALERLNSVNMRSVKSGAHIISYEEFYIPQLNDTVDIKADYVCWVYAARSQVSVIV